MPSSPRVKRVPAETIRATFRNSQYPKLITEGRLQAVVLKDTPLQEPGSRGEPPGTRSQVIRYEDPIDGQWLVIVHQYVRPDGKLGASGQPDPKWLRIVDQIFIVQS